MFDRSGAVVGLLAGLASEPRPIGGVAPEAAVDLVPATAVAALLADNGIAASSAAMPGTRTAGELAERYGKAVV
ncbi:hypothetical protein J8J40_31980, partial [Mycobacterium tuberculosis]|nr:hypothetical protein [Mycobacterium tuberculosis]